MPTFYTEGIVKDVQLTSSNVTFSILPSQRFAFEEKIGNKKIDFILLVAKEESSDELKASLKVDETGISLNEDKLDPKETVNVSGATLTKTTKLQINILGRCNHANAREAHLIPVDTKWTFDIGTKLKTDLGAFFVFMQNRTKIVFECAAPAVMPIAITEISIRN